VIRRAERDGHHAAAGRAERAPDPAIAHSGLRAIAGRVAASGSARELEQRRKYTKPISAEPALYIRGNSSLYARRDGLYPPARCAPSSRSGPKQA